MIFVAVYLFLFTICSCLSHVYSEIISTRLIKELSLHTASQWRWCPSLPTPLGSRAVFRESGYKLKREQDRSRVCPVQKQRVSCAGMEPLKWACCDPLTLLLLNCLWTLNKLLAVPFIAPIFLWKGRKRVASVVVRCVCKAARVVTGTHQAVSKIT